MERDFVTEAGRFDFDVGLGLIFLRDLDRGEELAELWRLENGDASPLLLVYLEEVAEEELFSLKVLELVRDRIRLAMGSGDISSKMSGLVTADGWMYSSP